MRFPCCPKKNSNQGLEPSCSFTRTSALPGSCWAPRPPWSLASSLAGMQGYRQDHHGGHPMESCLLTHPHLRFPVTMGQSNFLASPALTIHSCPPTHSSLGPA